MIVKRFISKSLSTALKDTPVVLLVGPRQCGKTTLVRRMIPGKRTYLTLDNQTTRAAAQADPAGLIRALGRATIDEIQLAPDLLRAIKESVDNDRRPGRFLLTGSANILTLPKVAESLAGRMEILDLLPLSRAELRGKRPMFLQSVFSGTVPPPAEKMNGAELVRAVLAGGYPEMLKRNEPRRRAAWARSYIKAIVERDLREIVTLERLEQIPRLLRVLTHFSGQLTNFTQVGGQIGLDDKTTRHYLGVLEKVFLVQRLQPWFRNTLNRLVKTPKLHFPDSGLLAALQGITAERIAADRRLFGQLLESFVFGEISKQETWFEGGCTLSHYRDKDQDEVDIVIENELRDVVGVEVKASATVDSHDFKGLRKLAQGAGKAFKLGVVLYDGDLILPFGERLFAAPVTSVWG